MDKLKPCPFCGAEAEYDHACRKYNAWLVICKTEACQSRGNIYNDEEEAIAAWNTRTALANPPLTLDELRDAMKQGNATYIARPSGEWLMREQTHIPCALDTTWVAGIDKPQIVAIYGRNLSFAESEYGITWLAYRHKPKREEKYD